MGKRASVSTARLTTEAAQVTSPSNPPRSPSGHTGDPKTSAWTALSSAWLRNSEKRLAGLRLTGGQFLFLRRALAPPLPSNGWEQAVLWDETLGWTMLQRNCDRASPAKADEVKSSEINREAGKKLLIQLYKETGESVSVSISPSGSWMLSVFVDGGSSLARRSHLRRRKEGTAPSVLIFPFLVFSCPRAFCPHANQPGWKSVSRDNTCLASKANH